MLLLGTGAYIRCETVSIDNSVDNSITSALLSGISLKMVIPQYHTITQTYNTGGGEINMNIVKSASKLSQAFITLYRQPRGGSRYGYYMPDNYLHKRWNYFYNTMINGEINDGPAAASVPLQQGKGFADSARALSWQLQIANKKYPEFECQSLSEAFYFLRRTVNLMNPEQNSLNISYKQYRENKFVLGVSFEKMPSVNFTSVNTKMGSLITFKLKGTEGALASTEQIQEVFVHLVSESVFSLAVSPGTWPGGAWVPGGLRPGSLLLPLIHDPGIAFLIMHQNVSQVSLAQRASPQFENRVQIFTSHLPMMD